MTKEEKLERLDKIREEAVWRFADKVDWDIYDWLDDKEREEYRKLYGEINGFDPFTGEAVI